MPGGREDYNGLSEDRLVRTLMLGDMQRNDYTQRHNQEIGVSRGNPEVKTRIEERLCIVPTVFVSRRGFTAERGIAGKKLRLARQGAASAANSVSTRERKAFFFRNSGSLRV